MSQVIKGVRKIFKKVVKVAKKVAPIALAAAALYFTGGAALGLTGMNWAAAASTVSSSVGATGVIGGALTGAITQAGYGALAGGLISEVSGGDFKDGAQSGAAAGALTGGLFGGASAARAASAVPPTGAPPVGVPPASVAPPGVAPGSPAVATAPPPNLPRVQPQLGVKLPSTGVIGGTTPAASTGGLGGPNGFLGKNGWLQRNQELAGGLIKGAGQGLLAGSAGDADIASLREEHRLRGSNYLGSDPGQGFQGLAAPSGGQTPTERYDPKTYGSFEYQYDPTQGRIVRVPVQ